MLPRRDLIYVGCQGLLFLLYIWRSPFVFIVPNALGLAALIIAILGIGILFLSLLQLNKTLSPFPTPLQSGQLVTTGLYKFARHPIYTGIILMSLGFGVYTGSIWRLAIALLLYTLFYFKSSYEEQLLINKYEGYPAYKKTSGRFFPKIF